MDTIKFADGSVYSCPFLSTIPQVGYNTAYIALGDVDFATAAAIFSDQSKTSDIEYGNYRLVGYTTLVGIYIQPYGIQAMLTGGHDERISES